MQTIICNWDDTGLLFVKLATGSGLRAEGCLLLDDGYSRQALSVGKQQEEIIRTYTL